MSYGFVYVMSNESMPGIYKIGMTEGAPLKRCAELSSSTSAPQPFEVMMYLETEDPRFLERTLHAVFSKGRVSENREFFMVDLRVIHEELKQWETEHCILAVANSAKAVMACAEYEERKVVQIKALEVL